MELRKQNVVLLATIALVATLQLAAARQLLVPVNDEYYSYMGLTLDSAMTVKNVENRAVGTFKITNPTKEPFKIAWITYDFGFQMSYPFPKAADGIAHLQKSDWQQTLQLNTCGSIKLPTTIAPGASITCPFSSRMNLYGGPMSVVARVFDGSATPEDVDKLQKIVAYDVLKSGLDAYNPKIRGGPEGNPTVNKTYTAHKDKAIPVHDIECETGQQFCKICGGRAAAEAKCNSIPICVAFDMEDDKCGYVKQANGPMTAKTGFTSWVAA